MVRNPFAVPWVGPAYAAARPNVHVRFVEVALREMGSPSPFARGLDIGCGTGLSSRGLRRGAQLVLGVDPAISMLRHAVSSEGISYVVAGGEAIPAADATFDIASIGCAFHWCDQERLFGEVARVVRPRGWFLIFDSDLRGWADGSREPAERLLNEYWSRLPPSPRNAYFEPTRDVSEPFSLHATTLVTQTLRLSAEELSAFIFTQASTVNAFVSGHAPLGELRQRLERCLLRIFAGAATKEFLFGGPLHVLLRC